MLKGYFVIGVVGTPGVGSIMIMNMSTKWIPNEATVNIYVIHFGNI